MAYLSNSAQTATYYQLGCDFSSSYTQDFWRVLRTKAVPETTVIHKSIMYDFISAGVNLKEAAKRKYQGCELTLVFFLFFYSGESPKVRSCTKKKAMVCVSFATDQSMV